MYYVFQLLYFAMDENPVEGILRALTITCCQEMPSSCVFQNDVTSINKDSGTSLPDSKVGVYRR